MTYICHKCNISFSTNGSLQRHMNKKNPCNEEEKKIVNENKRKCPDCAKSFCSNQTLVYHMDGRCKVKNNKNINKKQNDTQNISDSSINNLLQGDNLLMILKMLQKKDEDIEILKKENDQLKKSKNEKSTTVNGDSNNVQNAETINNTDNSINNIQNIHNDIKILAYGKEDTSFIQDDVYKQILDKGFQSVLNFVELVHFNKDKPENHNVYISNMRDNYVVKYDGETWKIEDREDFLQDMYENKCDHLSDKFQELQTKLSESTIAKFTRFHNKKDDDETEKTGKHNLKKLLYNKNNIVKKTRGNTENSIRDKKTMAIK